MSRASVKEILSGDDAGDRVEVAGWLRTARHGKSFSFLEVYDGSCFATLQCVADAALANYDAEIKKLNTGCAVRVTGAVVESQGKGQRWEVQASQVEVVGWADADYPLQKKRHSLEFLRGMQHLRMRTNTIGAVLRVRNAAAAAIHGFFQSRGFIWLHTPIITSSDSEGAGQMFRVTTLDPENPPRGEDGRVDYRRDFFGVPAHLTVSGQLEGEAGALAVEKIYTFGPTFRAENSNTSRHLAEFWMVEPEAAFMDLAGNMDLAEAFLKHLFKTVMDAVPDDLAFFNQHVEPGIVDTLAHIVDSPFERLTYTKAVELLLSAGEPFEFPVAWGMDLQSEHERFLTEKLIKRPVIVTDYPKDIKAFYMYQNDDGKTVRGMDVLVPRVGEIIGGAERECRLDRLETRLAELGLSAEDYRWYLDLRRFGSAPHAGFGLGFERAVQFITGMQNIRDVIPFPRAPGVI